MGTQLQLLLVVLLLVQMCVMNYKAFAQQFSEIYTNQKERSEIYTNKTAMTKPGCPFRCSSGNNVTIPYPFGIGGECALDENFVLSISVKDKMVRVEKPLISKTYSGNFLDWTISGNCSHVDKYQQIYTSVYLIGRILNSFVIAIVAMKEIHTFSMDVKDLEKATDRYNKNRSLGQGNHGTVYKEMLANERIVAIKVFAIVDEDNIEQFINEVVILSQISHRNVVKLRGCCLETEVPLSVYEFIPNGTLFQYIHEKNEEFPLSWAVRLRIANEVASTLSCPHSAASLPIYHQDIKSTNILLDEQYKAKVACFRTSRSIAIDQTHLTTQVSGTFGYLDPEYFQSSQFTEKNDFYSFGVVLVELLTSQKLIPSLRSMETRSLATYFMVASKEKCLFDILDA
ncbi:hypothetical protein LguiA_026291 [Lonicera macranthoides]